MRRFSLVLITATVLSAQPAGQQSKPAVLPQAPSASQPAPAGDKAAPQRPRIKLDQPTTVDVVAAPAPLTSPEQQAPAPQSTAQPIPIRPESLPPFSIWLRCDPIACAADGRPAITMVNGKAVLRVPHFDKPEAESEAVPVKTPPAPEAPTGEPASSPK